MGGRVAGRGHGDRPHRAGLRRRGLRAGTARGARHARPGRRVGRLLPRVRVAARRAHLRRRPADRRGAGPEGAAGRRRRADPPLSRLLALRDGADLPAGRRVVHQLRGGAPADDRRRPRRRVDTSAVRQADGGLAPQHGRLVHQPQALLGSAAAVLLLRVRPHDGDRVAGGAGRAGAARNGRPGGAAPALDRRRRHRLPGVQRRGPPPPGGRRLLAGCRDRPVLDAGLAQPGAHPRGLRHRRR